MVTSASHRSSDSRIQFIAAVGIVTLVALLLGIGAFLIGKDSGQDLNQARTLGETAGTTSGRAEGRKRGFEAGYRAGRADGFLLTYAPAYKRAYQAQFDEVGLEAPGRREIKVTMP